MRPADLSGALAIFGSEGGYRTGFSNPPGGQDPYPVCVALTEDTPPLYVPADLAVGFSARIQTKDFDAPGDTELVQDIYQYPNTEAAAGAWNTLNEKIATQCSGTFRSGSREINSTATRIPGLPGGDEGWGIDTRGSFSSYTTVHFLGEAIQLMTFMQSSDLPQSQVAPAVEGAVAVLAGELAGRWNERDSLPNTQPAIVTQAESAMLQPADIPATLPVGTPAQGAWSAFGAYIPGDSLDACRVTDERRVGAASFNVGFGSDGGPMSIPGSVSQIVHQYQSPEQARAAWESYTRDVAAKCSENATGAVPWDTSFERVVSGVSPLTFNGTPGLWYRYLTTNGGRFASTTKTYTIVLLVGSSIQQVIYGTSINSSAQIPLDQLVVNELAEELANRWLASSP